MPRRLAPSVFSLARGTPHAGRGHRLLDGGAGRKGRLELLSVSEMTIRTISTSSLFEFFHEDYV